MYGSWELGQRIFRRRGCRFGVVGRVVGRVVVGVGGWGWLAGGGKRGDLGELREGEGEGEAEAEELEEKEVEVEVEELEELEELEVEVEELGEEKLKKPELKELEEW